MNQCIAYRESHINGSVVYVPCGERLRRHVVKEQLKECGRFCRHHEQAYRELLLGIIEEGKKRS